MRSASVLALIRDDSDAPVVQIAQLAAERGLFLIRHQRTGRHALCGTVPAGWSRCGAAFRNPIITDPEAA